MDIVALQHKINRLSLLKYRYRGCFPSGYVTTLKKDPFAITITQPSDMQSEHWIIFANSRHKVNFVDFVDRPSFCKQQYNR